MRILGIDPGLATVGFALIDVDQQKRKLVTLGVIKTHQRLSFSERLKEIYEDLKSLIHEHRPDVCSIEQIFFSKNVTTGIQVAHARGVILLALEEEGIKTYEFTPSEMKLALTGDGKADKHAIQKMVKLELDLKELPKPDDAADALSLALTLCCELR